MQYQSYDLGHLKGKIVEVTLTGNAAKVKLMTSLDFSNYKARRKHTYYGGHVTRSPYRIAVSSSGHWHVTVDLGGYSGRLGSSIKVLP